MKRNVVSRFLLLWVVGMLLSVQVFAQGLTVKGVVKDNTGMGVIGANILVKGTTNGTITDFLSYCWWYPKTKSFTFGINIGF